MLTLCQVEKGIYKRVYHGFVKKYKILHFYVYFVQRKE